MFVGTSPVAQTMSAYNVGDLSSISRGQADPLEKEMATHSSTLAWGIPWMEEPGGLQSMGSQRVGHDLVTKQQQQRASEHILHRGRGGRR